MIIHQSFVPELSKNNKVIELLKTAKKSEKNWFNIIFNCHVCNTGI